MRNLFFEFDFGYFRWGSVIFGLFIFYRETFWFDTALPELVRLVSQEQGAALLEVNPRVHYAYCNYQEEDARGGCLGHLMLLLRPDDQVQGEGGHPDGEPEGGRSCPD